MRGLIGIFIMILICLPQQGRSHTFLLLSKLTWQGQTYTVAVMEPSNEANTISPNEERLADQLIQRTEDWTIQRYREIYSNKKNGKLNEKYLNTLHRSYEETRERSGVVVVMNEDNPDDILATERITWKDKHHPMLPAEEYFSFQYLAEKPTLRDFKTGDLLGMRPEKQQNVEKVVGDAFEIKAFVSSKHAKEDFAPLLFYLLENFGISRRWSESTLVSDHSYLFVLPAEYIIMSTQKMSPYFKYLGFQEKDQLTNGKILMSITREQLVNQTSQMLQTSRGMKVLQNAHWEKPPDYWLLNPSMLAERWGFQGFDVQQDQCDGMLIDALSPEQRAWLRAGAFNIRAVVEPRKDF